MFRRNGTDWNQGNSGYADHHYWLRARRSSKKHYGAWKPTLPEAGYYDVAVRIPAAHASSRKAIYKIRTETGWVTRVRNQKKRQGTWVSLGIHRLTTTPVVQLSDRTGERASLRRALGYDAIRFTPVALAVDASSRKDGPGQGD